jgi:hypothetical protein
MYQTGTEILIPTTKRQLNHYLSVPTYGPCPIFCFMFPIVVRDYFFPGTKAYVFLCTFCFQPMVRAFKYRSYVALAFLCSYLKHEPQA